ncbi:MAG: polyprenyl synthetase family protein [Desulfotomaculaceae bacterium]|nr:polyprenyl synthetase family protein [Desulfotomaculaceae bacterium]
MTLKAECKPITAITEIISEDQLEAIYRPISSQLSQVEEEVARACSEMEPTGSSSYLLQAGGKRIRPALVLLSSLYGCGPVPEVIRLAAAVEILHLATLVHDDLIDCSDNRRGNPTINRTWGGNAAILTGDYLYALFLEHTAGFNRSILASLAGSLKNMVQAELLQLQLLYNCDLSEKDYVVRTYLKAGSFLSCCCRLGAELAEAPEKSLRALERYGCFMGISFQIKDDLLDFQGDEKHLGKPVAQDLKQGVLTLPVIYTLKNSHKRHEIRTLIENKEFSSTTLQFIIRELEYCGALSYTSRMAERYAHLAGRALATLPDIKARQSLEALLNFILTREL